MPYTVVEMDTPGVLPTQVRAYGLYDTREEAEAARRRVHFANWQEDAWAPPRTFVVEIGEAR